MKKCTFLIFFFFQLCLFAQQENTQNQRTSESYVQFKNGSQISVLTPVVVCENSCYYISKLDKKCYREDLQNIDGFRRGTKVRWMTFEEFERIGSKPLRGYFWGYVTLYPTGLGIFILSDLSKRKNIRKLYQNTRNSTF